MAGNPQYMREYMSRRYKDRRDRAIKLLGGQCVYCSTSENLQFHHIKPEEKLFDISRGWNCKESKFWEEVHKCELRCEECHKDKHKVVHQHGTPHKYWQGCRCNLCTIANTEYNLIYRTERKLTPP